MTRGVVHAVRRGVARWQTAWFWLFFLAVPAAVVADVPVLVGLQVLAALLALAFVRPPRSNRKPVGVPAPVRGRWVPINSPGSAVPSHGVLAYGQAYAIDVLHPRPTGAPRALGWGLHTRAAAEHSCFGEPVLAVAAGTVVAATGGQRDHRARDTWPALAWMFAAGAARELGGSRWILGNHVVIAHQDGTCSAYAHLRRGSLRVRRGDRVETGQQLAEVGNSGNTSEPHLHFQLMDRPTPCAAAGVPFRWVDAEVLDGEVDATWVRPASGRAAQSAVEGVPANGQVFRVPAAAETAATR